jgi:hypothetical protein
MATRGAPEMAVDKDCFIGTDSHQPVKGDVWLATPCR